MNLTSVDTSAVDFAVERKPLFTADGIPTDREAIVKVGTRDVLGVVSKTYQLLEHRVALQGALQALTKLNKGISLRRLSLGGDGSRMYAELWTTEERDLGIDRKVGDIIRPMLILVNSVDGSTRFGFKVGALRLVCLNGMTRASIFSQMSTKHTSGVDFDEIMSQGSDALAHFDNEVLPSWRQMRMSPVNAEFAIKQLSEQKMGIPDMVNKRVIELTKETDTQTLWDLYNHYTYHLTHEYKGSEDRKLFISGAVERVLSGLIPQEVK